MPFPSPIFVESLLHKTVSQSANSGKRLFTLPFLLIGLVFGVLLSSLPFTHHGEQSLTISKLVVDMASEYLHPATASQIKQLAGVHQSMQPVTIPQLSHESLQPLKASPRMSSARASRSMQQVRATQYGQRGYSYAKKDEISSMYTGDGRRRTMGAFVPTGVVTVWDFDRGFGLIEPDDGGTRLHGHIKHVADTRVKVGNRVTYLPQWNRVRKWYDAVDVRLAKDGEGDHRDKAFKETNPESRTGVIYHLYRQKNIGFVKDDASKESIWFHGSEFVDGEDGIQLGNKVKFFPGWNDQRKEPVAIELSLAPGGEGDHRDHVDGPSAGLAASTGVVTWLAPRRGAGEIRDMYSGRDIVCKTHRFVDGRDSVQEGNKVTYIPQWQENQQRFVATEVRVVPGGGGDHRAEVARPISDQPVPEAGIGVLSWWWSEKGFGSIRDVKSGRDFCVDEDNFIDGKGSVQEGNKVTYVPKWSYRWNDYEARNVSLAPGGEGDHHDEPTLRIKTGVLMSMTWEAEDGHGYIRDEATGANIYVHSDTFVDGEDSVQEGNRVTFVTKKGASYPRYQAFEVRLAPGGDGDYREELPLKVTWY